MNITKTWSLIISVLLLIAAVACTQAETADAGPKVLKVDEVARHPEKYTGDIWVSGTVVQADPESGAFLLGCEDACFKLPVRSAGDLPKKGSNVRIFGTIKKTQDGKLFLEAKEVVSQ